MTPLSIIQYRDFYDVPRLFVVRHKNRLILFECPFDDATEDYDLVYNIYDLVSNDERVVHESDWRPLLSQDKRLLGSVPINDVQFDSTQRRSINSDVLAFVPD
jgi:hypothetical protein